MRTLLRRALIAVALVAVAIQALPVERSNPPVESEVPAPDAVRAILRRACYDCHSNETVWPWYSRVAPVSWLLARDVTEGRRELNYSTWSGYDEARQAKKLKETWDEVSDGEMPPWFYVVVHREAALSAEDREALRAWAQTP
jgi:heme-binding protein